MGWNHQKEKLSTSFVATMDGLFDSKQRLLEPFEQADQHATRDILRMLMVQKSSEKTPWDGD